MKRSSLAAAVRRVALALLVAAAGVTTPMCPEAVAAAENRPYAVATSDPVSMYCPQEVFFDGTGSYHGDPARHIVSYEWDYHYRDSFNAESAGATTFLAYGEIGTFTAALRVTDDAQPAQSDIATTSVRVLNRPPMADAGGPYAVAIGRPLSLSAAASSDPDQACADAVVRYSWDIDGDGRFFEAAGQSPSLAWEQVESLVCRGPCVAGTSHEIAVSVGDRNGLSAKARATVRIIAAPKKLSVTWPNGGEFLGTGSPQAIRWESGPEVTRVRVLLSADGTSWQVIIPDAKAGAGMATWTPPPAAHTITRRSWLVKVQGFRDGVPVASDVSDAPFGIGALDLRVLEKGAEVTGGGTTLIWARHETAAEVATTRFKYSLDKGGTWKTISIAGNPGVFSWKVPIRVRRIVGCRARLELYSASGRLLGRDSGEGPFTILGRVHLIAPEGGDALYGGTSRTVIWYTDTDARPSSTRLRLTTDGGTTWTDLAMLDGNPGHWHWSVPGLQAPAPASRVEVTLLDAAGVAIAIDSGEGFFTILAKGVPSVTAPPASLMVPATSGTPTFQVGWAPSATPGATYELEEATDPEFTAGIRTAYAGTLLSASITGRENGATYHYRVRALRSGWDPSPWVAAGNGCAVSWDATAPGPVADFTATVAGDRVDLAWTNPGDADFAGVRLLRRTDRPPTNAYDGTLVYDGPAQSFADVGLPAGAYCYAAFAYDASMNYAVAATAVAEVMPPLPPASITVPAVSHSGQCQVRWGASPTAGVTYELEEATDAAFVDGLRTAYSGSWLSIFLTGRATYGITYYYRVRALGTGRSPSAWVEAANGCTVYWEGVAPGPVSGFTATVVGNRINLAWVYPSDADFAGVRVLRRSDRFPTHTYDGTAVYDGLAQSFADVGLPAGAYYYAAFAYDASMNYAAAATAVAEVIPTPPLPPASITVPAVSYSGQYQVRWGASPTAGVTYELEEATDAAFVDGLRTAYTGSWLSIFLTGRATYGISYHYRVRALGTGRSPSAWVEGANGCTVYWEGVAPGPVTGFAATVVGNRINLAWINPPDSDFAGVWIVRRTGGVPANRYDGTLVYSGSGESIGDPALAADTYYYAAYARDASLNYSTPATTTAVVAVSPQPVCETCHNGDGDGDWVWDGIGYDPDGWAGPDPAAPNVMGDGVDPGVWYFRPYADGNWGYNVNGHGSGARPAECADCHDISIPAGTHLDGVLNSVELKQNPNENTAHLRAEFLGGYAPEWDVQVTFDNACLAARPELGGCHNTTALRHRHTHNSDPTPEAVRFGDAGTVQDGGGIGHPVDSDLSTNAAPAEPDFAPCVTCHDPHGTSNGYKMLRDYWSNFDTACALCHQ